MNKPAKKLLLIDDEPHMRDMLTLFLSSQGFEIILAENGKEGLQKFIQEKPDLTISDLKMPVMGGLEFVEAALKERPVSTILILTAFATLENAVEAMRLGAYDYLVKPIDDLITDLLKKVERGLERQQLLEENAVLTDELQEKNADLERRNKAVEAELRMGGVVQTSLLPDGHQKWNGIRYGIRRVVSGHVSGDYYDIAELEKGRFCMMMGQVYGRDLPSALLMSMISGTIRELRLRQHDPVLILDKANTVIQKYLAKGYQNFVSVFYGLLDLDTQIFRYASAAHPPPLLIQFQHEKVETKSLSAQGNYLGKYNEATLSLEEVAVRKGDLIVMYTENVLNVQNPDGETFGEHRLSAIFEKHKDSKISTILDDFESKLEAFHGTKLDCVDFACMLVRVRELSSVEAVHKA